MGVENRCVFSRFRIRLLCEAQSPNSKEVVDCQWIVDAEKGKGMFGKGMKGSC